MKKAAGYAIALLIGFVLLKACMADPSGSAQKVNNAGDTVGHAADSGGVFIAQLSGGTLLVLAIIGIAIWLSRR